MSWKMLVVLCFSIFFYFADGELFTAMADFEETLIEERVVLDTVEHYVKRREAKLDLLIRFSETLKNNQKKMKEETKFFWNPVTMYYMIRRLTDHWVDMQSIILDNTEGEESIVNITQHRAQDGIQFPTDEDVSGAALGLFRLQDTYALDTRDVADGRINGVEHSPSLTAAQCFDLGIVAHELQRPDHYHALLWLQEAYERQKLEIEPTINEWEVLDYLSYSMFQQGNFERAAFYSKKLHSLNPNYENVKSNLEFYTRELKEQNIDINTLQENNLPPVRIHRDVRHLGGPGFLAYESSCRGENNKKITPDLYCYFKNNNPYLRLAPLKAELLHRRPKLILFRRAISRYESRVVRDLGGPRLARAMVANINGGLEPASYRISKSGWISDWEHGVVERLSKRIEHMTDLTTKTSEDLQIANYGIGGHYETHYDFAQKHEKNSFKRIGTGNRIATVLFYLTAPTAGGATVFPRLNLTLYPSENDAVVWYNLYKSGEGDLELKHAACPVLSGIKWVANKWLHEHGQEFRRPCSLDEFEYE